MVGVNVEKQRRNREAWFGLSVNKSFNDPTKPAAARSARSESRDRFRMADLGDGSGPQPLTAKHVRFQKLLVPVALPFEPYWLRENLEK